MSSNGNGLVPREGSGPRLIEGPRAGQRSLYQQQVLDEDTYTDALSHIITRDFFPNLPHIHATNAYLQALTNNDPELLSSSIRRLAALAQQKEEGGRGSSSRQGGEADRRAELENMGTPYMNVPGGRRAARTPVGARAWDTPIMQNGEGSTRRRPSDMDEYDELEGDYGEGQAGPGPETRAKKKRKQPVNRVRDDLPLDAFQMNYTSEDNASFVQIVDEENERRREERWGWAWEAEKKAEQRRLEGETKRQMILDAATSGNWRVNADGQRLIGGLAEGGTEKDVGEAWKDRKLIGAAPAETDKQADEEEPTADSSGKALVKHSEGSSQALVTRSDGQASQSLKTGVQEQALADDHPLNRALTEAGLPATALVSVEDGAIVPQREVTSGGGEGRGRGAEDRITRAQIERSTMGNEQSEDLPLAGSGVDQWKYKAMNNLMFLPDANSKPYPPARPKASTSTSRLPPKEIKHSNTRLPDGDDEVRPAGSRASRSDRGSSPARSWVDAAVKGTPYRPSGRDDDAMPSIDNYPLLPTDPSPSPADLPSLLTWGTLLATPRALDGSDDPLDFSGPTYTLPETKRRDELGRKLADKASRSMNQRAAAYTPRGKNGSTSTLRALADRTQRSVRGTPRNGLGDMLPPSATPRRQAEALTPAGKRLLQRSMGVKSMGTSARNRSAAMEKGSGWSSGGSGGLGGRDVGKMSWTPSPGRRQQ
ncbi:nuclear protein DGCR14 [Kockovaella imperatae]|uniref:Nuclear protein DGCR14 n=1 Tax=Kockovaella imperatae TaxID=4999 RepID=A0A1Y1US21_9TREE|nr:nuclear protein DGCR14 [Kockovaella imperatae]ORX40830.1 nuclear protein DGCR14 [Kockovaella imperatae]